MEREHPYLSIEDRGLVGTVFDMGIWAYGPHDREELLVLAPDRVYGLDVHCRVNVLHEHVESLNEIPVLYAFDGVPFDTRHGYMSRATWLWSVLDLAMMRLSAVRDVSLFVVAEVFEANLEPREVAARRIRELVPVDLREAVDRVANAARPVRQERNDRVHRGVKRRLGADHSIFWAASTMEAMGGGPGNKDSLPREDGSSTFGLEDEHRSLAERYTSEFMASAVGTVDAVGVLLDALFPTFKERWSEKRRVSRLGDGYEVIPQPAE